MGQSIRHISDTSFWVAYYRALESEKATALFQDPLARLLIGERSQEFAGLQSEASRWTQWTVVMRTHIIDQMIQDLIFSGVRTFVNLGAGLDTRPYRMNLSSDIRWIEIDFPAVIEHKQKVLQNEKPRCELRQISLDLSDRERRQELFRELAANSSCIAVLTEGVLPYLRREQVSELSEDLLALPPFEFWIGEYLSPKTYRYLSNPERMKILKQAPFQFFPEDWMGFFQSRGWKLREIQYFSETSEKLQRPTPMPKIFKLFELILGEKWALPFKQMSGFIMWERK